MFEKYKHDKDIQTKKNEALIESEKIKFDINTYFNTKEYEKCIDLFDFLIEKHQKRLTQAEENDENQER